jgi:FkbH-like protein
MILRRSRFVHVVRLGAGHVLLLHALTHLRLGVDAEVGRLVDWFDQPRDLPADSAALVEQMGYDRQMIAGCVASLFERGVLTDKAPDEELAEATAQLARTDGRDPGEQLERFRRQRREGGDPYWAVATASGLARFAAGRPRVNLVLLGDCDLQMEANFLSQEGERRGLDLRVAATFPDDVRFVEEHAHDLVVIGALRSRGAIASAAPQDDAPFRPYVAEARRLLEALRARTGAPILIDNLPEPTLQPLGIADRGPNGHRNRYRRANLALDEMAMAWPGVHVVDIAAALGAAGSETLVDDGLTSFVHFGSPGWMLQRPAAERAAVHDLMPDMAPLAAAVDGDPYGRERVVARAHVDALVSVVGIDRKKAVIVDLDGVLWPGVLAETGSPFAWSAETSGPFSYIGLYFGLHEALKTLKRRGVVLAAVSKNDEAVVRALWTFPDHYPHERLLTPDDFVTWRVNWNDKADNIRSIAEEIGFGLDRFIFIDDHPVERERVRQKLPDVEVWGEEPFSLRRRLLSDPRLQTPDVTAEAEARTSLVKAQLDRGRLRAEAQDEQAFLASLDIRCHVDRLTVGAPVDRVHELLQRTTQFNTTGRTFSPTELAAMLAEQTGDIFTMRVADRLGDHGLAGAAIVIGTEIVAFVLSCRVIGMGVEATLLAAVLAALGARSPIVTARIVATARNLPARNLYRDGGFSRQADDRWILRFDADADAADVDDDLGTIGTGTSPIPAVLLDGSSPAGFRRSFGVGVGAVSTIGSASRD